MRPDKAQALGDRCLVFSIAGWGSFILLMVSYWLSPSVRQSGDGTVFICLMMIPGFLIIYGFYVSILHILVREYRTTQLVIAAVLNVTMLIAYTTICVMWEVWGRRQ